MRTVVLDYETFYAKDYTLRKMTPVQYVLDPRFEAIGCAVKEGNEQSYWVDGEDLPYFFGGLEAKNTCLVSHNALFDMTINAWRYGFVPRLMVDTMGVARALLGHKLRSLSLNSVAMALGLGVKGGTVHKVEGMNAAAIRAAGLYNEYIEYSCNDADLCAGIYDRLVRSGQFPLRELVVMDMVLRCAIEPTFVLDRTVLAEHKHKIITDKANLLSQVASNKDDLMSNERFAAVLRDIGVEPPMKISLRTNQLTYAFAKTDPEFMELEEHDDPRVQALVAARLGVKSTIEETRTERFIAISNLVWPDEPQCRMPMPLRYSGAHTHRLSGDWKLNVQNMPRGGALRRALTAPPGYQVVAADASQIEARIVAWLCGVKVLVEAFANKQDVYSLFASSVFRRHIDKKKDPAERFIGKTAILGLGYGLGWPKFQRTVKLQSKAQTGTEIALSDAEAMNIVNMYRSEYREIPLMWKALNAGISTLASGVGSFSIGPCVFGPNRISLPSGLHLHYHDLRQVDGEWRFTYAGKSKKLYGGALLENITQALARIIVMDAGLRLQKLAIAYAARFVLQVHDELVYVVPDAHAEAFKEEAIREMRQRPLWAPDLPLDAEGGVGLNYGEAK